MKQKIRLFIFLSILATAILAASQIAIAAPPRTVDVQILALNDFHGNLMPPSGSSGVVNGVPAGGVEYLATHIANLRAQNPRTVVVSAGDMVGASPLLSALFHDEPTIEAFNLIGLDFNAVGNHEFDEGWTELVRLQEGGCHPVDGCLDGDDFAGADFQFLAANVVRKDNGHTIFPAYKLRSFAGVKVAFIGMTLEGTPSIVSPAGIADLNFLDEAETVNALVPKLKALGVETIVVLIHEGGTQVTAPPVLPNGCVGMTGPIVDIVNNFDDEVDVVISGHTHQAYNCVIDGKLVTSASSFGRLVTKIDLTLDKETGEAISMVADNRIVTRDVPKDTLLTALIDKYNLIAAPLANRVVGTITADINRTANAAGESALGDVIADGQLDATNDPGFGDAVMAFMNPGGIRADLVYAQISGTELPGEVTYGEIFNIQPFGNSLVTLTLTGAQIDTMLEQQFVGCGQTSNRILQVSTGFSYTWSLSGGPCNKVDPATIMLNGVVIDPTASYRVTVNSFLADGGDNFFVLKDGTDRLGGDVDLDAFEKYFANYSPLTPGTLTRITVVP
ncbi:MAG TPA: bifunctional metallophosphatase/5'-nucleotidase [Anaerolineales bacterium]|nr:bifunctional metallophosphatase/5'-nucleotidase [Anaerolineales bacterium]